jgi:hypothetical protein
VRTGTSHCIENDSVFFLLRDFSFFSIYLSLSLTGRIEYNERLLLRVILMRDWCFSCRLKWENVAMIVGYFQCLLIGQRYFVELIISVCSLL